MYQTEWAKVWIKELVILVCVDKCSRTEDPQGIVGDNSKEVEDAQEWEAVEYARRADMGRC